MKEIDVENWGGLFRFSRQGTDTICGDANNEQKVHTIPKMLQLALQESTLTFQLYYWILLGVNFNIHVVLCNEKGKLLIVGFLQNVTLFAW